MKPWVGRPSHVRQRPLARAIRYVLIGGTLGFTPGLTHPAELGQLQYTAFAQLPGLAGDAGKPALVDLDGDGDLDVVAGSDAGSLSYFENTGTVLAPGFALRSGVANPFAAINVGFDAAPALADIDGDGDLDLVVGSAYGNLRYFENTGSAQLPGFSERTGSANPFGGIDVGGFSAPHLSDIDGDGDIDALVGGIFGDVQYLRNDGSPQLPLFVRQLGSANPFAAMDAAYDSTPVTVDLDGDGDLDTVLGGFAGQLRWLENTGAMVFVERTGAANPLDAVDVGLGSKPAFADLDADGDADALVSDLTGFIRYIGNQGDASRFEVADNLGPLLDIDVGRSSAPDFVDLDGDGDLDAVVGEYFGELRYYENQAETGSLRFVPRTGGENPLAAVITDFDSVPSFGDVDGDGDLDAFVGEYYGTVRFLENTGTRQVPVFVERTGVSNPVPFDFGYDSAPRLVDLDGDGDLDLVVGSYNSGLRYFERTGSAAPPSFTERFGADNPFDGLIVSTESVPEFADLDGDGDLDLLLGDQGGLLTLYENTGTAQSPNLVLRSGNASPFAQLNAGPYSVPRFVDLDGDGDLDLAVGNASGKLEFARNITPLNRPPVAADDSAETQQGIAVRIAVLANDSDPDGDALSLDGFTPASSGLVALNGDGSLTYTPGVGFSGIDSFGYNISDGRGGIASASVTVTVVALNRPPTANTDTVLADEDQPVVINVLANDTDPDGDLLTLLAAGNGSFGSTSLPGDGTLRYTPNANFNGADSFSYSISDGRGGQATGRVDVTVRPVNDAPVAQDDAATLAEEGVVEINVLANDSDIDGDSLSVAIAVAPLKGQVSVLPDQRVRYQGDLNASGSDSLVYRIADPSGLTATATLRLTINPVNDAPLALDDSFSLNEDTPTDLLPLANDSDPDQDNLSLASFTQPSSGSLLQVGNGLRYTPNANFNGVDAFTYTVSDGRGGLATANVSLSIQAVNDAPTANDDQLTVNEDTFGLIDVLANDVDVEPGQRLVDSFTQATSGIVSREADGRLRYTPAANFNGNDSFGYTLRDAGGLTDTALVQVRVNAVNDAPVAVDDRVSVNEDGVLAIDVLGNDTDVDQNLLSISGFNQATEGEVSQLPDGRLSYRPRADFNGQDSFTYSISDGQGGTDSAIVIIDVAPVNDPPLANPDSRTLFEDAAELLIDVLGNDTDPDQDPLTLSSVGVPAHGQTSIQPDGRVRYVPAANYHGDDSFTYVIGDGQGGSATGVVSLSITAVNDAPVANDDLAATDEDSLVDIAVLGNDSDIDGDALIVTAVSAATSGTVSINPDGSIRYRPGQDFSGSDQFSYTLGDGRGGTAAATVTVNVRPVNDAPLAVADSFTLNEDTPTDLQPLANDSDPDQDSLSLTAFTQPSSGSLVQVGNGLRYTPHANFNGADAFSYTVSDAKGGLATASVSLDVRPVNDAPLAADDSLALDEDTSALLHPLVNDSDVDGDSLRISAVSSSAASISADGQSLTYVPALNFNGDDSFTYTISDGKGGSATAGINVTVRPVNDAPVAVDDFTSTLEDTPVALAVLVNDSDLDGDPLIVTAVSTAAASISSDGQTITYVPEANVSGVVNFSYTVSDGRGGAASANVEITVRAANDAVVANPDAASTNEDTAVELNVLANDIDADGDALTVAIFSQPAGGSVQVLPDQRIRYVPTANFNGIDSFQYSASDATSQAVATVTIRVLSVNDAPVAQDDAERTAEDTVVTIPVLVNDTDPEGQPLTLVSATQGSLGATLINPDNSVTYTPASNASGVDRFSYTIRDSEGATASAMVEVTIDAVNDPPVALADAAVTPEDQAVSIAVLSNDQDADGGVLSLLSFTQPANGTVVALPDQRLRYTPAMDFSGIDRFSYTVSDGTDSRSAEVTVTVQPVDDPPRAIADSARTLEDVALVIPVLANDFDVEGQALILVSATNGSAGTTQVNPDNTLTYTPAADYYGNDSFTYKVRDAAGLEADATVSVVVEAVNDPPLAVDDAFALAEDGVGTFDPLANDIDPEAAVLSLMQVGPATRGSASLTVDGRLRYQPDADFAGVDVFSYTVSDGQADAVGEIRITVTPVNDAPQGGADTVEVDEDGVITIDVLANDVDVDGDRLRVNNLLAPQHGQASLSLDGRIEYRPNPDYHGADSFEYSLSDGAGGFDVVAVSVTVRPINDPPMAGDDAGSTRDGVAVTLAVLENDVDVDGDALRILVVDPPPAVGQVEVDPAGQALTYHPPAGFNGTVDFGYRVADVEGLTAQARVGINVAPADAEVLASNDQAFTDEDTAQVINVLGNDSDRLGGSLRVQSVSQPALGSVEILADQRLRYTPMPDLNGEDSFTYLAANESGATATASVRVAVRAVNDPPRAVEDLAQTLEDTVVFIRVLDNDTDVEGQPLTLVAATPAQHGTTQVEADGSIRYQPAPDFNGEDSFLYTLTDGSGGVASAQVHVTVGAVNDGPQAVDDQVTGSEDETLILDVLGNDFDVEGGPLNLLAAGLGALGEVVINADQTLSYTPPADFNGEDVFSYTVGDGSGSASAEVRVQVLGVNDAPVATGDTAILLADSVEIDVLANDTDVDGDTLRVSALEPALYGTVSISASGRLRYVAGPGFDGSDSFEYVVSDDLGGEARALVTIRAPSAPLADAGPDQEAQAGIRVWLTGQASDFDGDIQSYQWIQITGPAVDLENASAAVASFMVPDWDSRTLLVFRLTVSDSQGLRHSDEITILVKADATTSPPSGGGGGGGGALGPGLLLLLAAWMGVLRRGSGRKAHAKQSLRRLPD